MQSKRVFQKYTDPKTIIQANELLSFYDRIKPNDQGNEELWRLYKETGNQEYILQYIANNKPYFVLLLCTFFRRHKIENPKEYTGIFFEALKKSFDKSTMYVKSYFAKGVMIYLYKEISRTEQQEKLEKIDDHIYEDEPVFEAIDRLYNEETDYDMREIKEIVLRVVRENPKKRAPGLQKLIVQECQKARLTLQLYEYLQSENLIDCKTFQRVLRQVIRRRQ